MGQLTLRAAPGRGALSGSVWTAVGMATSSVGTLLANFVLVAFSSSRTFADMAVLTVATTILSGVFRIGTDRIFVAEVGAMAVRDGQDAARRHGARLIATAGLSAAIGVAMVLLGPLTLVFSHSVASPLSWPERDLMAAWLAADIIRMVVAEAHRAQRRFLFAAVSGYGLRSPLYLLALLAAHLAGGELQRWEALAAAAGASVVVCVASTPSAARVYKWWTANPFRGLRRTIGGHVLMLVSSLSAMLIGSADVWIVGATMEHRVTAQYGLAVSAVAGLAVLSTAINGGLSPYIATAIASKDTLRVTRTTVRYVRFTSVLAAVGFAAIACVLEPLARTLGGQDYRGVTAFAVILGLGQVISTMAGLSGYVLTAARHYHLVTIVTAAVAAASLLGEIMSGFILNDVVVLAVFSASATAALPIINNIVSRRRLGIRTDCFARRD